MVDIRSRGSWGARYPDGDLTLSGLADEVFAHHTVTTQLPADASVAQEEAEMRKIEAIGQSRFGTGLSYNVIVFPSGRAYQGASFHRRGTHTGGRNSTSRSICFAGNYEVHEPTDAQIATASAIYHEGKGKWWKSSAPLRGHRDVKGTACPGKNVYSRLPQIRAGYTAPKKEEFLMSLSEASQEKLLEHAHAASVFSGQSVEKLARIEKTLDARRRTDLNHMRASAAREVALLETVKTLASAKGVDMDQLIDSLNTTVRDVLQDPDFELVLTPKETDQ